MEIINDYSTFRAHCTEFFTEFSEKYLAEGSLFCHPLINGLILALASEDEAKSNDPMTICRLSDVMLMSADGESGWKPFDIKEARETASVNEHIFLSDLLFRTKYIAHDWMIDGKHDAVIVSEQYMKDHNKPYAPITPLTNIKLRIKKIRDNNFWKQGTLEAPGAVLFDDLSRSLDDFSAEKLDRFPVIANVSASTLPLGEESIEVSADNARNAALNTSLEVVSELKDKMNIVAPMLKALGVGMTAGGYSIKFLVAALNKNGVETDGRGFRTDFYNPLLEKLPAEHTVDDELSAAKQAFKDCYVKNNKCGFKPAAANKEEYYKKLQHMETASLTKPELLSKAAELLSDMPADGAVFKLLYANFNNIAEDISAAEKFWFGKKVSCSDEELDKHLRDSYIPKDAVDEKGAFTCGHEKAKAICGELAKAADVYRLANSPCVTALKAYIDEEDKKSRIYNGTLFSSSEEMKKAVQKEAEISKLCADLTALNKDELVKMRRYIYDSTVDDKTKAKYLAKVKLAENDIEQNTLKQMSLPLANANAEEARSLLEKIKSADFDDTVKKPFLSAAEDRVFAADAEELAGKFKNIAALTSEAVTDLKKELEKGSYSPLLKKIYSRKADLAVAAFAEKEAAELCSGMESFDKEKLDDLKKKLTEKELPSSVSGKYLRKIARLRAEYDKKAVADIFKGIAEKSKEELDKLRDIINKGTYPTELTDPYISKIAQRETAIKHAAFEDKCKTIPTMDKAALEELKKVMASGEYPDEISSKYIESVKARETALRKAEIADLCKDINKMNKDALKDISVKLSDDKYPKEETEEYFAKIKARELALDNAEVDELCKDMDKMDRAALKALSEKLSNEKYNKEYTAKYFDKIKEYNIKLDNAEVDNLCKDLEKMDRAALKTLSEKISDEKYSKDYTAKYFDRIKARNTELDKAELTELTKNIGSMTKPELVKLTEDIITKYDKDTTAPFVEKIRAKEIELMKKELENLCKNIPSTPRPELSKLKEALKSGGFDNELAAKYISQIEEREKSLVKTELKGLCGNIEDKDKAKLIDIKLKISDTPEYAEEGRQYVERIDNRLKKLDKEEFDRMMNSIDRMNEEELDKFSAELEKRKSTMDAARFNDTVKLVDARFDKLEKDELEKICGDVTKLTIEQIASAQNTIEEKGFKESNSAPYIKKLNDAANQVYIKDLSKLTENLGGLEKPALLDIIKKIDEYGHGCPNDLKNRYKGTVNKRIRDIEDRKVADICRGLDTMTMNETLDIIKKIKEIDMDEEAKKRHISNCENHILSKKKEQRDDYAQRLNATMNEQSINQSHIITPMSPTFDSMSIKVQKEFAPLSQFDLMTVIHVVDPASVEEGFAISLENVYCHNRTGTKTILISDVQRFVGKKGVFGSSLKVEQKNGNTTECPSNLKGANCEKVAVVLNALLDMIQASRAAERRKDMERIAAKNDFFSSISAAPPEVKAAPKTEEQPKTAAPKAETKPADVKPVDVKPVDVKPVEVKTVEVPAAPKPVEVPKVKPVDIPEKIDIDIKPIKHIDTSSEKPDRDIVKDIKPIKPLTETGEKPKAEEKAAAAAPAPAAAPTPAPAPTAAPASAKPIKMKFCDQCGAKIVSDTAKFCMECGNRIG